MRKYIVPILLVVVASAFQGNLPPEIKILGAKPDLVLVVLIAFSLAVEPEFGATLGFIAGLVHGCQVGASLGSFIVTRTITGFLAGMVTTRLFSDNPLVPMFSAVWLTAVCELLFLVANPSQHILHIGKSVIGECIFNALLTLVLNWVIRYFRTGKKIRQAYQRARI